MESTLQQQALSTTQQNLLAYFETHDVKYVAEDAVFRNLSTGEVYTGRAEIGAMLHYIYHVAFDARGEMVNHIITEDKAVMEAYFKGRHIGEMGGIPATNMEVDVPLCVSYDLKDGLIKEARIYMLGEVMMKQLGIGSSSRQKVNFLVRDVFKLKFGHYRPVKELLKEAMENNLMPEAKSSRVLTDFTGDSYRLIFENGFDSLFDFETSLSSELAGEQWQAWYKKFMEHVESSYREILKEVF
jgi:hypothetical protein